MQTEKLVRNALTANAIFSTLTGISLIAFDGFFQSLFQVGMPFWTLGISLLGFAGFVYWVAKQNPLPTQIVQTIIVMDLLWVIGSAGILFLALPVSAKWIVGIVAVFVGDFAYFQYKGLKKIQA